MLTIFEKKSHSAKKIKKEDPLVSDGFVGYVEKVKKKNGVDPLETKKIPKKKSHSAEKNRNGGLFTPVRFCRLP